MISTTSLLAIVVAIFLALAAFNVPSSPRMNWGWFGMLLWFLFDHFFFRIVS